MSPEKVMDMMLKTFNQRGEVYGDNWKMLGPVLAVMFPDGITLDTADDFNRFQLFVHMMTKMCKLAVTDVKHEDSALDVSVYGTMLTSLLTSKPPTEESK